MPWFVAPSVTAASPVRTPARAWMPGPQRSDGVDELERGTNGTFGVVLVRDGGTPHRHDRVADELLDRAAVSADHVLGELEVARQKVACVLGVATLGEGREPDQIGKQDRDEPPLGDWGDGDRGGRVGRPRRGARGARHGQQASRTHRRT